jgi:hypothetical protein
VAHSKYEKERPLDMVEPGPAFAAYKVGQNHYMLILGDLDVAHQSFFLLLYDSFSKERLAG